MSDGIYVALSGAIAQTESLDNTATNLANASTDGYQRVRIVFREALANASGTLGTSATQSGVSLDTTRGALRTTGNALDVALPDQSYLAVGTSRGERYTRAGALAIGSDGILNTSHGDALVGNDGRSIRTTAGQGPVTITPSGEVWQADAKLGRLRIVTFPSPERLAPEGGTLLNAAPAAGTPVAAKGELSIGALEESNTSVVGAMTDLVSAGRNFDAFQRVLDTFQQADDKAVTNVQGDS